MLNNTIKAVITLSAFVVGLYGCSSDQQYHVSQSKAQLIEVSSVVPDSTMLAVLKPYQDSLSAVMDVKIGYSPVRLEKTSPLLGTWLAKLSMDEIYLHLSKQGIDQKIDMVLYNSGGMRTGMPEGDIRNSFVYEFMPFDNACVLVKIKGDQVSQMLSYLTRAANAKIYHPIYGLDLKIYDYKWTYASTIGGAKYDPNKTYTILTSDFLQGGGDGMTFLQDPIEMLNTKVKIREQIANYFTHTDTISIPNTNGYDLK